MKNVCYVSSPEETHRKNKLLTARLLLLGGLEHRRNQLFWKPERHSGHQDPENTDLIQKLAEQWECGVDVGRGPADDPKEKPHADDAWNQEVGQLEHAGELER